MSPVNKRTAVLRSCRQCRTKRQKCSRGEPCEQCVARGEGNECDWQGAKSLPKHILRGKNDLEELREKLNRLEEYIGSIRDRPTDLPPTPPTLPPPASSLIESPVDNLVSAFTRLALPDAIRPLQTKGGMKDEKLIKEARNEIQSYAFTAPQLSTDSKDNFVFEPDGRTLEEIITLVPPLEQVDKLLQPFYTYQDIAYHPFHIPTLKRGIQNFRKNPRSVHPHFLASLLAILAMTLLPFHRGGPPTLEHERALKQAKDLARSALRLLTIEPLPTVEGVRAHILTGRFYWVLPGDDILFCRSMFAKAVFWANELAMTFDPDSLDIKLTLVEKEERRRIAFILAQIEFMNSSLHGRIWTPLDSGTWSVKLPSTLSDEEIDALSNEGKDLLLTSDDDDKSAVVEPSKTVLNFYHQCALILRRIDTEILGQAQISYFKVIALGKELEQLEKQMPEKYRYDFECDDDLAAQLRNGGPSFQVYRGYVNSAIAFCYIKLYQPFFSNAADDVKDVNDYRQICIDHARHIMIMQRSPIFRKAGLAIQFYGVCSAVVLAVACLRYPNHKNYEDSLKDVKSSCECLAPFTTVSSTMRRSVGILQFILRKIEQNEAVALRQTTKRTRRTPTGDETSPVQLAVASLAGSTPPEERPRKVPITSWENGQISHTYPSAESSQVSSTVTASAEHRPTVLRHNLSHSEPEHTSFQFTFQSPPSTNSPDGHIISPTVYYRPDDRQLWSPGEISEPHPYFAPTSAVLPPESTNIMPTNLNAPVPSIQLLNNDAIFRDHPYPIPVNTQYPPPNHPPPISVTTQQSQSTPLPFHQPYPHQDHAIYQDVMYESIFNKMLAVYPKNVRPP